MRRKLQGVRVFKRGLSRFAGCLLFLGGFIAERNFRQADRIRINERIRAREVRVIDEEGGQLGVMQPFEAVRMARERGLDLVEISPTADPPVCKITDYGKFLYQQTRRPTSSARAVAVRS